MTPFRSISQRHRAKDGGVALIVVLLLMATLSTLAVAMTSTIRLTTARTLAGESAAQARWYALGAETFSALLMEAQWRADPARDLLSDQWVSETATLPLDNGIMTADLRDNTVCFNLNSLVDGGAGERSASDERIAEYELLLEAVGFGSSARGALTDSLVDWLDSDNFARSDGAEDSDYASLDVPYRAANALLADVSELRTVYWYSPEVYQRLLPFVCAHPTTQASAINLNMVTDGNAPVLYAMLGGKLSVDETKSLIAARPQDGYTTLEQFWASHPQFETDPPSEEMVSRPNLWCRYVRLDATVSHVEAQMAMTSELEISKDGTASVLARRFGLIE